MIIGRILQMAHFRPSMLNLIIGSTLTALIISLGIVGILKVFDFAITPTLPAVFAAIGAATFAARMKINKK